MTQTSKKLLLNFSPQLTEGKLKAGLILIFWVNIFFISCSSSQKPQTASVPRILNSADMFEYYYEKGEEEYEQDRLDYAMAYFDSAIAVSPENPRGWERRGSTLGRLKRHTEGQAAFDEALRLNPKEKGALWHKACGLSAYGNKQEALDLLRRLIEVDSTTKTWPLQDECFEWLWKDKDLLALTK